MEKHLIPDRRIEQMPGRRVEFKPNSHVGVNVEVEQLVRDYDAVLLAGGAEHARDLSVPGRELKGIHFAMDFLPIQNKVCEGDKIPDTDRILATGKRVVIIGGGDTGADCLGTSHRHKALSIHQFEYFCPNRLTSGPRQRPGPFGLCSCARRELPHEEGGQREWSVATTSFSGDADGNVTKLHGIQRRA